MKKFGFKNWLLLFIGIVIFLLGGFFLIKPEVGSFTVAILVSLSVLSEGLTKVFFFFADKENENISGLTLFSGILNIVFAIVLFMNLNITTLALCLFVGLWLLVSSVLRIVVSIIRKKTGFTNWWTTLIMGILSTILSIWLLWNPLAGATVLSFTIALTLLSTGAMIVGDAFSR